MVVQNQAEDEPITAGGFKASQTGKISFRNSCRCFYFYPHNPTASVFHHEIDLVALLIPEV